ncbi:MAG: L-lactate permease [Bryobacterales bacterium]|nr:L-lactate permease [Bryobacterales bacterium]
MYNQVFDPVAHSLSWSALFASLPLLTLFMTLGVLRWEARRAALLSLAVSIAIATGVYAMPLGQVLAGAAEGAAIGFFPILWVGISAIWLYRLTEVTGHSLALRRAFDSISDDVRIQAIFIAFCFGSLLEGLAGGGSPVAICTVMLVALRVPPVKAAVICLIADTAPVSFGALGLPITTLAKLTGLPIAPLSAMIGRQTPFLALVLPFILLYILDGRRGLREIWPFALVSGVTIAAGQSLGSLTLPVELVDIVSALVTSAICVLFLRVWSPSTTQTYGRDLIYAVLPYVFVVLVVVAAQIKVIRDVLGRATSSFAWPGLSVVGPDGAPVSAVDAKFEWLLSSGSLLLIAGVLVVPFLGVKLKTAVRTYGETLYGLRWTVVTVSSVVGLAYVMNLSGQIITLGLWAAGAGSAFAPISPLIGWLGSAVTGSDTSSNALFGMLQVTTARHAGLPEILLAAANTSGGVVGKAISPQNLSIAAVAVGLTGREGYLFRQVFGWTLLLIAILSLLVFLQSTSVLSWMIPS